MTTCSGCGVSAEPPTIQGMKLELPNGWAVLAIHRKPITAAVFCRDCLDAVDLAIAGRRR